MPGYHLECIELYPSQDQDQSLDGGSLTVSPSSAPCHMAGSKVLLRYAPAVLYYRGMGKVAGTV